jgi:hypothetical protein
MRRLRVPVGRLAVLLALGVIALLVMLCGGAVGLGRCLVVFGGLGVCCLRHGILLVCFARFATGVRCGCTVSDHRSATQLGPAVGVDGGSGIGRPLDPAPEPGSLVAFRVRQHTKQVSDSGRDQQGGQRPLLHGVGKYAAPLARGVRS